MDQRGRLLAAAIAIVFVSGITAAVTHSDHAKVRGPGRSSASVCHAWDAATTGAVTTVPPPGSGDPVAPDGGADLGVLDNGLHYFIRSNSRPGANAELRLVGNAGSSLEDPDQSGAAHFLEHMLFNGTEQFPGNELTKTLQSLGVQLGADLNASTSYDETVYSLAVDATNANAVSTALDVLYQWATKATIAAAAVESERGVILQEERQRDETAQGRAQRHETDLLLGGSAYAGRAPIGTVDSIKTLTADTLRRFYTDWYRPDLMAVVAVGDFDVSTMESDLRKRFEQIPPASPTARPRPAFTVAPSGTARIDTFDDPESTSALAEVVFPTARPVDSTGADVRAHVARNLAVTAVQNRLARDAARGLVPYYRASQQDDRPVRPLDVPGLTITSEPAKLREGVFALLSELARARRSGFNPAEVARAVSGERQAADQALRDATTRQDTDWADAYTDAYLKGVPVFDAQAQRDAIFAALDSLTAADVATALRDLSSCRGLAVLATGPDSFADTVPTTHDVETAIERAGAKDPGPRAAEAAPPAGLMDRPAPADIVDERNVALYNNGAELTFANGVRVVINPTPIQNDGFVFGALSPGGLSAVADSEVANAQRAPALVDASGVGSLDAVQVQDALAGHVVDLSSTIDDATEGFSGSASTADLEALLQLVHLRMMQPRVDNGAMQSVLGDYRVVASDPNRAPRAARLRALDQVHFGDAARERTLPTPDDLKSVDATRALAAYQARFGDASDFVFAIVGTFDFDTAVELARSYLGTLPGTGRNEAWTDVRPDPPRAPNNAVVRSGHGTKASITVLYDTAAMSDPATKAHAAVLELVLRQRLFDRIREALSATYSPTVSIDVRDRPDEGVETSIEVQLDASRVDEIVAEIDSVLGELMQPGRSGDEAGVALTQLLHQASYYSNRSLADAWLSNLTKPGGDPADEIRQLIALRTTTPTDVTTLAAQIWPADHRLEVRVVPVT